VYATHNGQRADITLPDGSKAFLNVASQLEVPTDFAAGNRTLRLRGEALFSVAHQHGTPFTVVAGPATVRVLGTSFVVRHYATDSVTTVAVRDGRIGVGSAIVAADQEVTVSHQGMTPVSPAAPSHFTFAAGVLTLDGIPLKDAIVELDRWYDADIRLADPALGAHVVQMTAAAGSLADVATMLAFTFDARVVRNGRVITLYSKQ
jgi:ferric-dicitrate binding protein FerR (iron transport regulator)